MRFFILLSTVRPFTVTRLSVSRRISLVVLIEWLGCKMIAFLTENSIDFFFASFCIAFVFLCHTEVIDVLEGLVYGIVSYYPRWQSTDWLSSNQLRRERVGLTIKRTDERSSCSSTLINLSFMFKCWFILENRRPEKKSNSSFVNISIEKSSQSTRASLLLPPLCVINIQSVDQRDENCSILLLSFEDDGIIEQSFRMSIDTSIGRREKRERTLEV